MIETTWAKIDIELHFSLGWDLKVGFAFSNLNSVIAINVRKGTLVKPLYFCGFRPRSLVIQRKSQLSATAKFVSGLSLELDKTRTKPNFMEWNIICK